MVSKIFYSISINNHSFRMYVFHGLTIRPSHQDDNIVIVDKSAWSTIDVVLLASVLFVRV